MADVSVPRNGEKLCSSNAQCTNRKENFETYFPRQKQGLVKGQLQTLNRREVNSEWTGCQAQLHGPKEKKSHDG